jgi:hypothetical protein
VCVLRSEVADLQWPPRGSHTLQRLHLPPDPLIALALLIPVDPHVKLLYLAATDQSHDVVVVSCHRVAENKQRIPDLLEASVRLRKEVTVPDSLEFLPALSLRNKDRIQTVVQGRPDLIDQPDPCVRPLTT